MDALDGTFAEISRTLGAVELAFSDTIVIQDEPMSGRATVSNENDGLVVRLGT